VEFDVDFVAHAPTHGPDAYSAILGWTQPLELAAQWKVERCSGSRVLEFSEPLLFVDVTRLAVTIDSAATLVVMGVIAPIPGADGSFEEMTNPRQATDSSRAHVVVRDSLGGDVLASGLLEELPSAYRSCPPGLEDD
jgi:hypothetical protein